MTDLIPTYSGEIMLASWKETHTGGAVVSFFLPDPADLDVFRGMTVRKGGTAGQRFMAVLVEVQDDETMPQAATPQGAKPWGKEASLLYRDGTFFNPKFMQAVGTDQQYLDWLKARPCCVRCSLIADKAHEGDEVGGKDQLDHERARNLSRWMAQTVFNKESMGFVPPTDMRLWAKEHSVEHYLPAQYK